MKPVDQTRIYDPQGEQPPGNCFAACLASILELPLEQLPDEAEHWRPGLSPVASWRPYWQATQNWLRRHGLAYLDVNAPRCALIDLADAPLVITGDSPRDAKIRHAVVGQFDSDGYLAVIHDPHPSRDGLVGDERSWDVGLLVARQPSRFFLPRQAP